MHFPCAFYYPEVVYYNNFPKATDMRKLQVTDMRKLQVQES
jgi:hypothetical protein